MYHSHLKVKSAVSIYNVEKPPNRNARWRATLRLEYVQYRLKYVKYIGRLKITHRVAQRIKNVIFTMPARLVPHCKACVVAKALSTTLALPSDWRKQALSTIDLLNLAMMALIDVRISEMLIMEMLPKFDYKARHYALALEFGREKVAAEMERGRKAIALYESALGIAESHNLKSARWILTCKVQKQRTLERRRLRSRHPAHYGTNADPERQEDGQDLARFRSDISSLSRTESIAANVLGGRLATARF